MADAKRRFLLPDQLQQFEDSVRVICIRVRDNNGIKSGNACILRCGKEAWRSANAIVQALRQGLRAAGLPETAVCLIEDTTHASANALMTAVG